MLVDAQKIPAGTCDLYFFGGIFGSGKSTLCQTLSRLLPGTHLKASELIGYVPNQSDPTGKSVREVLENQERLVSVLADLCTASANVLLDGHFCLLDEKSAIVRIPVNFFKRIHPTALVLVESGADEVLDRLRRRDGRDFDQRLINALLQAEREHSERVSDALGVPIMNVNNLTKAHEILAFLRGSSEVAN